MTDAHWIRKTHLFRSDEFICSCCGVSYWKPHERCPSCRSVMGGVNYDPSWVDEAEELSTILDDDW